MDVQVRTVDVSQANVRTAAQNVYLALVDHDRGAARRARHFLVVIGVFLTGALAGAWLTAVLRGRVPHGRVIRSTSRAWSSCSSVSSPRSR